MDKTLESLATALGAALEGSGRMTATAESCTGGWIAATITAIAGSSAWFDRGFVTYSNEAKTELLGVPVQTIEQHGAVSEPTARAMAEGALARSRATLTVAVTGVAGPSGGSPTKPVGTVCFGWAVADAPTLTATHRLPGDRTAVRRAAVVIALEGLIRHAKNSNRKEPT